MLISVSLHLNFFETETLADSGVQQLARKFGQLNSGICLLYFPYFVVIDEWSHSSFYMYVRGQTWVSMLGSKSFINCAISLVICNFRLEAPQIHFLLPLPPSSHFLPLSFLLLLFFIVVLAYECVGVLVPCIHPEARRRVDSCVAQSVCEIPAGGPRSIPGA